MSPVSRAVLGAPQVTGAVRRGTLAMTLVVRDEEDILETNLRYHLAQGVDFIYALDHNSVDATPDILRSFEQMGVLRMLREGGEVHDQAPRVTRLARLAHDELGADWVINNDADEFWWPAVGDLKDLLCAIPQPFEVLVARRHDFIPRPDGPPAFHDRMLWRRAESRTPSGQRLEAKAAHRGDARIVVAPGNHDVQAPALRRAPALPLVEVLHYPARDYEQFVRKTLHTGRGYELLAGRDPTTGIDQLLLLELYRRGELRDYFDRWALPDEEIEAAVCAGHVVRDVRLRDYLAGAVARPSHDPQQVRDVVAGALGLSAELSVAQAEAELLRLDVAARKAELADRAVQSDAALAALSDARAVDQAAAQAAVGERDREVARLHDALEQVRNSRLMRSTRALRRVYYKLK
jgi:hypothetical protein